MNPCFGCMSIRTGALVIGIIEIILYGLGVLLYGFSLAGILYAHNRNSTEVATTLQKAQEQDVNPILHTDINGVFIILSLMTILCLIQLVVGVVLVVGVQKSSQLLLKTWMGVKVLVIMLSVILLLVSVFQNYSDIRSVLVDTLSCLIGIYFLVVVYALTDELKKGGTGGSSRAPHGAFKF